VALHFLKFVLAIAALGLVAGLALGAWLGALMTGNYVKFFRLPAMHFVLPPSVPLVAALVTLVAPGCRDRVVRSVVRLAPRRRCVRLRHERSPHVPGAYRAVLARRTRARFVIRNLAGGRSAHW